MNYAAEIKRRVSMPELVSHYGFEVQKGNRIPCFAHGGKNSNLGIKKDYCHCFKCGYTADVIKFVQDYFSLSFPEAIEKINIDFTLGLPIGDKVSLRKQRASAKQTFDRRQETKKKEQERERLFTNLLNAHGELHKAEQAKKQYKPLNQDEPLHPEFIRALKILDYARYKYNCADEEMRRYEEASD